MQTFTKQQTEVPILDGLLIQRVARAHGFQRSGRLIADRILEFAKSKYHLKPDPLAGNFVWLTAQDPEVWNRYRSPQSESDLRKIEEIAFEELSAAVLSLNGGDIALEVARIFGVRRLPEQSRERINSVIFKTSKN